MGFSIILHCFDYNRAKSKHLKELKIYCEKVYIYSRKKSFFFLLHPLPFIVRTRRNKLLLKSLLNNNYPILFEGIHTTAFLDHPLLKKRFKVLRTHNIENEYYKNLSKSTTHILRKWFYRIESWKLKRYEHNIIPLPDYVLAISDTDKTFFSRFNQETKLLMPSLEVNESKQENVELDERFILFHGNLSVPENEKAALFLIREVFPHFNYQVIIAGKKPSNNLKKAVALLSNVRLVDSPSEKTMEQLIIAAHIHLLFSFQDTGVKLKLLKVIQNGKFCVANDTIVGSVPVKQFLYIANTPEEIFSTIKKLMPMQFDKKQYNNRKMFLSMLMRRNETVLNTVFYK